MLDCLRGYSAVACRQLFLPFERFSSSCRPMRACKDDLVDSRTDIDLVSKVDVCRSVQVATLSGVSFVRGLALLKNTGMPSVA